MLCIIHRSAKWSSPEHAAGIGVEFLCMTDVQQNKLEAWLETCADKMEKELEMDAY